MCERECVSVNICNFKIFCVCLEICVPLSLTLFVSVCLCVCVCVCMGVLSLAISDVSTFPNKR